MKFFRILVGAPLLLTVLPLAAQIPAAAPQDKGYWRASDSTARSITGDIAISGAKLTIGFSSFPIAQIRSLTSDEAAAAFDVAAGSPGGGNLYRLMVPAAKRFQHHNTLCGSDETQWMATWSDGRELNVAFFSGSSMPVLRMDVLENSTSFCGTFRYAP